MTRIADSSFLIAAFHESDRFHRAARKHLADPEPILVPAEVVGETLGVVQARYKFPAAYVIWEETHKLGHVRFATQAAPQQTAEVWRRNRRGLSWVDACVVAWCRLENAKAITFDPRIEAELDDK